MRIRIICQRCGKKRVALQPGQTGQILPVLPQGDEQDHAAGLSPAGTGGSMSTEIIPFQAAKKLADEFDQAMVIIVTYDRAKGRTHVVTYGRSLEDSDYAAAGGDFVKKALGWPDQLRNSLPPRVEKLAEGLRAAVDLLQGWHNLDPLNRLNEDLKEEAWRIYFDHSPEMKPIREALALLDSKAAR